MGTDAKRQHQSDPHPRTKWQPHHDFGKSKAHAARGQDPDLPIEDRDILYVPGSVAKDLVNRTMESAIQSTLGVTIYSALVYSQRY